MTARVSHAGRLRVRLGVSAIALAAAAVLTDPAASAASAVSTRSVLIEAYGDSTTLGISCANGHCAPLPDNAVTALQDRLRDAHSADAASISVTNLAVGGTMASQLLDGTDRARGVPWRERMSASSAQIVMINYGINEMMHKQTPDQFYAAETALVQIALKAGKRVVLQTSNPMPDPRFNTNLAPMIAMTRRVAAEQHVPLVDQYAYISGLSGWQMMMSDGAHPKPALYRLKAAQDFAVVEPLIGAVDRGSNHAGE
ncbi:GDSL-type esterase/lipase family protein [Paraburkholderia sp.]|uniref:SGNH/GDSL hydrolase family protein n=1 Tax=Paraburkholderia sp. TaxID=1926495 RepID=UPI0023867C4D|nr:GDSL-type esterase/lipase family protein [Paraburkholderia sp.]MDE1184316.1 GDSL-type esterase/lipase family protein [Paraburkholderia sp.]